MVHYFCKFSRPYKYCPSFTFCAYTFRKILRNVSKNINTYNLKGNVLNCTILSQKNQLLLLFALKVISITRRSVNIFFFQLKCTGYHPQRTEMQALREGVKSLRALDQLEWYIATQLPQGKDFFPSSSCPCSINRAQHTAEGELHRNSYKRNQKSIFNSTVFMGQHKSLDSTD